MLIITTSTLLATGCLGQSPGTEADAASTEDDQMKMKQQRNGVTTSTDRGKNSTMEMMTADDSSKVEVVVDSTDTPDSREYDQTSGGTGYRNDSIDAYKGIDGSARDKGPSDEVPNPR